MIGGGALALYGISRRSAVGVALAAGGGTVALLGVKQRSHHKRETSSWTSLLINCSPQEAFRFFRDFENLPRFMKRLDTVTVRDHRHSRWTAIGPLGRPIHLEIEITNERENEHIAWQALPGSDLYLDGRVEFQEAPAGRGTLVSLLLDFKPAAGANRVLAKFLSSRAAKFAVRQDLRRLEAIIETGELPTTEGQPHGPRDVVTGVARLADPTRPIRRGSNLKELFTSVRRNA